jgi:type IV pilus assembly protein PilV
LEVLVTVIIVALGLLGLAGLMARLHTSEMEGYQRAQAVILLEDMVHRIDANRKAASTYVTTADSPLGTGMTCPSDASTLQQRDASQWCAALQGAAEKTGTGTSTSKVGAMIGGRGCVEDLGNSEYMVTVAWQGVGAVSAPPDSVACGKDLYNDSATCAGDRCRRAVTSIVKIAPL